MAKQTVIDSSYTIEDGKIKILETIAKELSRDELQNEKMNHMARQVQIQRQIADLNEQFKAYGEAIVKVDKMIDDMDNAPK